MTPSWLSELKQRYLSGRASVFLVVGGQDTAQELRSLLAGTRDLLGEYHPSQGLYFEDPSQRGRFQGLIASRRILESDAVVLDPKDAEEGLALIYQASRCPGLAQGYLMHEAQRYLRGRHVPLPVLPAGVPSLSGWPQDADLRAQNSILLFLSPTLEAIHPSFLEALGEGLIEVSRFASPAPTPPPEAPVIPSPPPLSPAPDTQAQEGSLAAYLDPQGAQAGSLPEELGAALGAFASSLQPALDQQSFQSWLQENMFTRISCEQLGPFWAAARAGQEATGLMSHPAIAVLEKQIRAYLSGTEG